MKTRPLVAVLPGKIRSCAILASVALLLSGGCASGPPPEFGPLTPETAAERLPFLRDGITSKAECLARLGAATAEYDHDHTLIYVIEGYTPGTKTTLDSSRGKNPRWDCNYDLVLSFDEAGVLCRHTLVQKPI